MVGGQANRHHSIKCEVKQCEAHEEHVPEEFSCRPFKPNHGIYYYTVNQRLDQDVWNFYRNLQFGSKRRQAFFYDGYEKSLLLQFLEPPD